MKHGVLAFVLAWIGICGCAGRMNVDLLQARIRQQEAQLTESKLQMAKTKSELKQSRLEAERLKSELAHPGETALAVEVQKVRINPLASGGLNKDDLPGDDTVVINFVPLDTDQQPVKIAGDLELVLIDPQLPPPEQQLGQWSITAEDCLDRWTRGITGAGFQISLPLEQPPVHSDLVVQLQFTTQDSRRFMASQRIKVHVVPGNAARQPRPGPPKRPQLVDDSNEILPPVGDRTANRTTEDPADWDQSEINNVPLKSGPAVLHSANWTDATIPQFR